MAKRKYNTPIWMEGELGGDIIEFTGSQGTSGDEPQFTWDPAIDEVDIDLFWASYDETDLAEIAGDDLYVSYDEFYDWLESIGGW